MITNVEFPTEEARPGEVRRLVVEGASPIHVEIKCFTHKPPPPGFKGCPECGVLSLGSREVHLLRIPKLPFAAAGGELHILLTDSAGDRQQLTIAVAPFDQGMWDDGKPGAGSGGPGDKGWVTDVGAGWQPAKPLVYQPGQGVVMRCCS